jgi:hypothetical protein
MKNADALPSRPAGIGHNQGPLLDLSWNAWVWRRAHAQAWKPPGREIAMLRLRRAERLGLSYRDVTTVILNRGVYLEAPIVIADETLLASADAVLGKLRSLCDCTLMMCSADMDASLSGAFRQMGGLLEPLPDHAGADELVDTIKQLVRRSALAPSTIFAVGMTALHQKAAEQAGLGLFVDARVYFPDAVFGAT